MKSTIFWDITLCSLDAEDGGDMFLRTSVDTQRTTGRYIAEDGTLQNVSVLNKTSSRQIWVLIVC
jgi:hypothetical protein